MTAEYQESVKSTVPTRSDRPPQHEEAIPFESVFGDELREIERRWQNVYSEAPERGLGESERSRPTPKQGLVGLALSGGGLRSATFNLGLVQALHDEGVFDHVDYLSTVSGGGFLGSSVSGAMRDGGAFPYPLERGGSRGDYLGWLRSHSRSLAPRGFLGFVQDAADSLRGVLVNLYLLLPLLLSITLMVSAWHDERTLEWRSWSLTPWLSLLVLAYFLLSPVVSRIFKVSASRSGRQGGESSVKLRSSYQRSLAAAVLLLAFAALIEYGVPFLIRAFQWLETPKGLTRVSWSVLAAILSIAAASGGASVSARLGRVPGRLRGPARLLGLGGIALSSLLVPVLVLLWVSEFLTYDWPVERGFLALLAVVGALALGTIFTIYVGARNVGLKETRFAFWLLLLELGVGGGLLWAATMTWPLPTSSKWGVLLHPNWLFVASLTVVIWLFGRLTIDGNSSSALGGFRDRLATIYLIGEDADGEIDIEEDISLGDICRYEDHSIAPYHLINAAINLYGARSAGGRDRGGFTFSRRYTGGRATGYCETRDLEAVFPQADMATAMAISSAAGSPGFTPTQGSTGGVLRFLLNIRTGYWLPNPRRLHPWSTERLRTTDGRPGTTALATPANRFRWGIPPRALLSEVLGRLDGDHDLVNVTDGGYRDNTAAMELLRRRCKYVIAGDAEVDPGLRFQGLATLIRRARTDLGIDIDIDLDEIRLGEGHSRRHFALGRINYPDEEAAGYLLYLKASTTGDEDEVVTEYGARRSDFPHEPSADQYLDEGQFEAYRTLGVHIGQAALAVAQGPKRSFAEFEAWFGSLESQLPTRWGTRAQTSERPSERPVPPDGLLDACKQTNCVLFAGSGLAAAAGYPNRKEFLLRLAERGEEASVTDLIYKDDLGSAAEILGSALTSSLIRTEIEAVYGESRDPEELAATLAGIRFRSAVSTGWDEVVSRAYPDGTVAIPQDTKALGRSAEDFEGSSFVLTKLYGDLEDPDTLVLSPNLVKEEVGNNRPLQRFVSTLFASHSFFFCGASLEEIEHFVTAFKVQKDSDRKHYALVEREEDLEAKRTLFDRKYGIEITAFDPMPDGKELLEFLGDLAGVVPEQRVKPKAAGKVEARTLDSVYLQNIGAFEEQTLEFHEGWNVLLGNNGCGKSTILKAIALALCGEDPVVLGAAGQLLRRGESRGVIELKVGQEIYKTTIEEHRSRITIKASKETPLERGQWAALAFPPLRGVSKSDPKGPSEIDDERPDIQDVLPLLNGEVDTRMDSLKQWIVNTHTRAKSGDSAKAARVLLESFFTLMQELMPGVKLERPFEVKNGETVDVTVDDNFKVWVDTDDGRVPIGLVSQGMHSVVGWAGHALQRLSAIYPGAAKPEEEPALVLVDELDAHMHPKWQVLLAPAIKNRFKNLQVIATSHSPLIAANMAQEEIRIIQRDESGVSIHRTPESFKGWRVDQILTSLAFNLEGARDADTNRDFKRYLELSSKFEPSKEEEEELAELGGRLNAELPSAESRATAMQAYEILEKSIQSHLASLPDREKEQVMAEIRFQLQGLDTEPGPQ